MLKQTIQLFIKASIIGILINAGLEQIPATSIATAEDGPIQLETEGYSQGSTGNTYLLEPRIEP